MPRSPTTNGSSSSRSGPSATMSRSRARSARRTSCFMPPRSRRNLLERGGMKHDVRLADRARDRLIVADGPDLELEDPFVVGERGIFGGRLLAAPLSAHLVLLGLVPREHDDLRGFPELARHQAAHERLPERARAAGDEDTLTVEHPEPRT